MNPNVRIDVYVELICPWCLIGKRHLARALEQLAQTEPELRVDVQWHLVQLIPQVPAEGWPFAEFYQRRLGSPEAVRQRQAQVKAAAAQAGVEIDFARIERFPNTTLAHRLLAFVAQHPPSQVEAMIERDPVQAWLMTEPTPAEAPPVSGVPLFVFNGQFAVSGAQPSDVLLSAIRQSAQADALS